MTDAPSPETGNPVDPPPNPQEVLEKLEPEDRRIIESTMTAMMQFGPAQNPLLTRVTAEHIDKLLDHQDRELTLSYEDRKNARMVRGLFLLAAGLIASVVILVLALNNHESLLQDLIPLAVVGLGGFTGGYGYSEIRRSRD